MKLTSAAFRDGGTIPRQFTCDGEDRSPPLAWSEVPDSTRAFALVMDDPDAPPGTWVHWVLYDLPGEQRDLPEGLPGDPEPAGGARHGRSWGVTSFERTGYGGPCPPPGRPHRYVFRLYALKERLGLPPGKDAFELRAALEGKVLAEARLVGRYGR